ncbi:retinaldehyde-binding protein 1 [Halyomorpha halys]|uniref:retinaldehyde-binding protein 1 n=1 Tax=Halyomorpha halys TaxID=286706 RepID=UPI0006D4F36B|nr:clavesin-2 [Halyomorpha halys]XP_014286829.1 clavesin-2 [Halyomorpha halys]XP_014286830.1 clavesin-2 [Halyomorpha halys]
MDSTISQIEKLNSEIPEEVMKRAKDAIREDETTKEQMLDQFKHWVSKNNNLQDVRTDDNFLLRFLRTKKYSLPMAQDMLLKYLNLRQTYQYLAFNMDFLEPSVLELVNKGYLFPSPIKDKNGRTVIIGTSEPFDPHRYTHIDMTKMHGITYECLLEDEQNQILGFTHFGDIKHASPAHLTIWSPIEFPRAYRWAEQSMPMMHKEIHLYKLPAPLRYTYELLKNLMSTKIRERIMLHDTLEELHGKLDPKVLPKEYGGIIPMADMIELWKFQLVEKRDRILALDKMKLLDNSCLMKKAKSNKNQEIDVGSFRKLAID